MEDTEANKPELVALLPGRTITADDVSELCQRVTGKPLTDDQRRRLATSLERDNQRPG